MYVYIQLISKIQFVVFFQSENHLQILVSLVMSVYRLFSVVCKSRLYGVQCWNISELLTKEGVGGSAHGLI
jgi:hypothetical protein